MMKTPTHRALVYPKLDKATEAVRQYAASVGGLTGWNHMNYADESRDVFARYGAANMKKMKDMAARYDPQRTFQKLCPGGRSRMLLYE